MRVLITGGAIRLGAALTRAFWSRGATVLLHHNRSVAPAQALAQELGERVQLLGADLSDPAACQDLGQRAAAAGVDVVVHNAGLWEHRPFGEISLQEFQTMQAVNLQAPFLITQAALPALRASVRAGGGCVLHITDIGGQRPVPGFAHYSVSKAGLEMLTRALALELAPLVRVNAIAPGTVLVPEHLDGPARTAIQATIPAGRFGQAEDIARAALFLVDQPYITGQTLAVDGGRSIGGPMTAG